jgi:arylsulfatase A-like enzyme
MQAAGYRTALVGYQVQLSPRFGMDQGFDFFNNNTMGAQRIDKRFLGWLDEAPDRPFFAYLHYLDIHWPYCPPEETFGRFDSSPDALRLCEDWRALRERIRSGEQKLGEAERRTIAARYAEELVALDGGIGRLVAELERRGVWDETLVVLTSDHGEELAERGMIEHGHTMYDELLHVPFVWKLPASWGRARGRSVEELVETRSLLPTLFELVGRPVPAAVSAPSLLPWLRGEPPATKPYERIVAEANGMFVVRTERWKLVVTPAESKQELYDLVADPGERTNLAATRPAEVDELRSQLRRWRAALRPQKAESAALDEASLQELKNLGYL